MARALKAVAEAEGLKADWVSTHSMRSGGGANGYDDARMHNIDSTVNVYSQKGVCDSASILGPPAGPRLISQTTFSVLQYVSASASQLPPNAQCMFVTCKLEQAFLHRALQVSLGTSLYDINKGAAVRVSLSIYSLAAGCRSM